MAEEEENKFDFQSFLNERKGPRNKNKQGFKKNYGAGTSTSVAKNGGTGTRKLTTQTSGVADSAGPKRKTNMQKR